MPCPLTLTKIAAVTATLEAMETGRAHYDKASYHAALEERDRLTFGNGQEELAALFAANPTYLGSHSFLRFVALQITAPDTAKWRIEDAEKDNEGLTLADYLTATVDPSKRPQAVMMLGDGYAVAFNRRYDALHLFRL